MQPLPYNPSVSPSASQLPLHRGAFRRSRAGKNFVKFNKYIAIYLGKCYNTMLEVM